MRIKENSMPAVARNVFTRTRGWNRAQYRDTDYRISWFIGTCIKWIRHLRRVSISFQCIRVGQILERSFLFVCIKYCIAWGTRIWPSLLPFKTCRYNIKFYWDKWICEAFMQMVKRYSFEVLMLFKWRLYYMKNWVKSWGNPSIYTWRVKRRSP